MPDVATVEAALATACAALPATPALAAFYARRDEERAKRRPAPAPQARQQRGRATGAAAQVPPGDSESSVLDSTDL